MSESQPVVRGAGTTEAARRARTTGIAIAAILSVSWTLWRVFATSHNTLELDFNVYVMGAHHLTDGRLYHVGLPTKPHLPFTYPPFSALSFIAIAAVPHQVAQLGWAAISVLALLSIVAFSLHAVRPELDRRSLVVWSLILLGPAFAMEPVWLTFNYGQINLVLVFLILGDLTLDLRCGGHRVPRGIGIGITAAIKLIPLIFIPYLFLTRQARAAWTATITFVICTAISFAVSPSTSWSYWTHYATDASRVGGISYISNQSLRGTLDRLAHQQVSATLVGAVAVVVLIAGLLLARWAWATSSPFLGVLLCADTSLLVSPITWAHHMVWIVPTLIWLVWGPDRPAVGRVVAAAGALLFWWAPIWHVPFGGTRELHENWWQLIAGNSFDFATVLFMIAMATMLEARRRRIIASPHELLHPEVTT